MGQGFTATRDPLVRICGLAVLGMDPGPPAAQEKGVGGCDCGVAAG